MTAEIINTKEYVKISTFAEKVKGNAALVRYYAKSGALKSIEIDGCLFVHLDEVKKWPPEPRKQGRPPKLPTQN